MKSRDVHLRYSYEPAAQRGAAVQHPLFELLAAVHAHGSIQRAAQGMGASYRHVWGALKQWQDQLGEPLVSWTQGHPARLTPFGERLLQAEAHARARLGPQIDALRSELAQVLAQALDGPRPELVVCGAPDPALAALRDTAAATERLHLGLRAMDGLDALRLLAAGRCDVAALHVPLLAALAEPLARSAGRVLAPRELGVIGCSRHVLGLAVAAGNPMGLRSCGDVARQRARWVRPPPGTSTRLLADRLLVQEGLGLDPAALHTPHGDPVAHAEEHGAAVASAVAWGLADAGLTTEADARACALDFVPLAEQACVLVGARAALAGPAMQALRRSLRDPSWQQAVAELPGCAALQPGELLPPAQVLPGWAAPRGRTRA